MKATLINLERARAKVRAIGPAVKTPARELLAREGRLVAISCAKSTQPYGTGAQSQNAGQNRVAADIYRVYATAGKIYGGIRSGGGTAAIHKQIDAILGVKTKFKASPDLAKQFWKLWQLGKFEVAVSLLKGTAFSGVPLGRFDGGTLHIASRSAETGRVYSTRPKMIVRNPLQLATYIARKQKLVGFGKSAWTDIARQLGGLRGLRSAGDITANWITRNGGPGEISWNGSDSNPILTMTSRVRYGGRILPARDRLVAVQIARERLRVSLRIAAQYEARHLKAA